MYLLLYLFFRRLKNRGYESNDEGKFNINELPNNKNENTKAKSICTQCNL